MSKRKSRRDRRKFRPRPRNTTKRVAKAEAEDARLTETLGKEVAQR